MRFITAKSIFSGKEFLSSDSVLILSEEGIIVDIINKQSIDNGKIEFLEGIITPGFINTHCHLELSHLKNTIPKHTGIVDFGLQIIKNRNLIPEEEQIEHMNVADKYMWDQGIVAVGDISNTPLSISAKKNSSVFYHTFVELIALNPERANMVFESGKDILAYYQNSNLSVSLAPHAPYSASKELIKLITTKCHELQKPTSIHNQESKAENDFFTQKAGDYLRLYETINVPIDYFKATGVSSLQNIISSFNQNINTLLVHNTFSSKEDLSIANHQHHQLYWCLCPNANLYIENSLPDITLLQKENCTLTLGTDSLASNNSLSVIDEINCLINNQPYISIETLLKAATYNGAKFLGIENQFGSIEKNKKPGLNLIWKENERFLVKKLC